MLSNNNCFFSVIIPTYNSEKFIAKTINSVCNQTYKDFEIVVSDDGSTDNTVSVVEQTCLKYSVNLNIIKGCNSGPGAARNRAVSESNGVWMCFLDSDDQWLEEKLEIIKRAIDDDSNIGVICHSQYWNDGYSSRLVNYSKIFDRSLPPYISLLRRNSLATSATCIKKTVFTDVGCFDESLFNNQDYDLWLRTSIDHQFSFVEEPLGIYTVRSDSISRQQLRRLFFLFMILRKQWPNIKLQSKYPVLEGSRYIGNKCTSAGFYLVKSKIFFTGGLLIIVGLLFWPMRLKDFLQKKYSGNL
jgi:glycosyltransferase involved in cell wall biosynthesis